MIEDVKIAVSTVEKDLGVIFDNKLKFHDHVAEKCLKANRVTGIIRRSFSFLDKDMLTKL